MRITTTVTVTVSPENEPLIAHVVGEMGGVQAGETLADAVARIRTRSTFDATYAQIYPHIAAYFGKKDVATAAALDAALRGGAIDVSTLVE